MYKMARSNWMSLSRWTRLAGMLVCLICLPAMGCDPSTSKCVSDEDCEIGKHCDTVEGACIVSCRADRDCASGQKCNTTRGKCAANTVCEPKAKKQCVGKILYWFDSCDYQGEVAEDCGSAGCVDDKCQPKDPCGDGTCEAGKEDCLTCPTDCGCKDEETCKAGKCEPADTCGNGTCDAGKETCSTCPGDCACDKGKMCDSGTCKDAANCGDGKCEAGDNENCVSCPLDCQCPSGQACSTSSSACVEACGDGKCDEKSGENCSTCEKDCAMLIQAKMCAGPL